MKSSLTHNNQFRPEQNQNLLHFQRGEIDDFIDEKMDELLKEKKEGEQDAKEK